MARLVLLISLMVLTGCRRGSIFSSTYGKPRFKAGDCVTYETGKPESWEKADPTKINKIIEVGREKYHVIFDSEMGILSTGVYFGLIDDINEIVQCPEKLANVKLIEKEL